MNRTDILKRANECVTGSRQQDYGEVEDNFRLIADLWSAYIGTDISAVDVAMMMALFKIARIETAEMPSLDSYVDAAGYIACGGGIELEG